MAPALKVIQNHDFADTNRYSDEYKREAIELVRSSGRTVTEVARELGISSESLRGWVKKARAAQDAGSVSAGRAGQNAADRDEELRRLRKLTAEQAKTIEILKKSDRLLREGERPVSEICRFIHAEKANYPVVLLCKVMKTARSTYYAWVAGAGARGAGQRAGEALAHQITVIHIASRRNYGAARVTAELRRQGRPVNRKRVARVMREHGIAGNSRRTGRRSMTRSDTRAAPSPDLTGRDFTATRPGTKVVGDITYIPTAGGRLYLASWPDLATREVIGYSMADHHRAELVVDALDMASALGRLEPGCVIHSDRGSEYTSGQLRDRIRELGHRQSMGRTGSCFDNAAAESFWAVLKEEIGIRFRPDRATARADIFDFIETFYNRRRLREHIHWGYLTPHETRLRHQQDQALAA